MRLIGLLFAVLLSTVAPAFAQAPVGIIEVATTPASLPPEKQTCSNATMTGSSQPITLTAPSQNIDIVNTGSNTMYLNTTGGAASAANTPIPKGTSYAYRGYPLQSFTLFGTAGDVAGVQAK